MRIDRFMPKIGTLWTLCAILAVTLAMASPVSADPPAEKELESPRPVEFRLADGARIQGSATSWSTNHFDGSFGKRFWYELQPDDVWRVLRRIVEDDVATDWIRAGEVLLTIKNQSDKAEYAFRRAREIDPDIESAIKDARQRAAEAAKRIAKDQAEREKERLSAQTPEARDWGTAPWPAMTPVEWRNARERMMLDAEQIVDELTVPIEVLESAYYIMYTSLTRREAAQWLLRLDRHYESLRKVLGLDEDARIYWGKPIVFVWKERDTFRLIEANHFRQLVQPDAVAVTHFQGPQVFINAWRKKDDALLESALAHETVHAFMHSFLTPRRLPAWANEGLAELFAQRVLDSSYVHQGLRPLGLQLIRSGFPVIDVLNMKYSDGTFPGQRNAGYAIGQLIVEHMIRQAGRTDAFVKWVREVKLGADWKIALARHFNGTPEGLAGAVTAFYRVND